MNIMVVIADMIYIYIFVSVIIVNVSIVVTIENIFNVTSI
jgi:hypothetical protein